MAWPLSEALVLLLACFIWGSLASMSELTMTLICGAMEMFFIERT
jgi:hypothetical protein